MMIEERRVLGAFLGFNQREKLKIAVSMQQFLPSPAQGLRFLRSYRGGSKRKKTKKKSTGGSRVFSRIERLRSRKMRNTATEKKRRGGGGGGGVGEGEAYILEGILLEILKRLLIVDLLRCTSVCKSWYSFISGPNFISLHSQHIAYSTKNPNLVLFRDCPPKTYRNYVDPDPRKELYSLHLDDEMFERYKCLDCPVTSVLQGSFLSIVGSVNGVICLSDDHDSYSELIHLWNPSIRKCLTLPYPIFGYPSHGGFFQTVGFGFDATTNDFKVVRVVYLLDQKSMVPPKVEICEPRVGSWREVDAKGFSHIINQRSPQAFLHGIVHWEIGCNFIKRNSTMIASFDLRTEEFCVIKVPASLNERRLGQEVCVSVLGESLSLIEDTCSDNGNSCCIWVMKQYGVPDSWTKLFTIDVIGHFWWVFGFRRNGEALVKVSSTYRNRWTIHGTSYDTHQNLLVSLEPKSSEGKLLTEFGDWESLYLDTFVESLALLGVKGESADMKSAGEDSCDSKFADEDSCDSKYADEYSCASKSADEYSRDPKSAGEDSCDSDDGSRFLESANRIKPNSIPLGQVTVSWFG